MKQLKIIIILMFIVTFTVTSQEIKLLTEENAPFSYSDTNGANGIAIEILDSMFKKLNRKESVINSEYLPWARSYQVVQNTPNTVLFPMARTAEREDLFKWVGPIYELQIGVLAKKANNVKINSSSDFIKYTIGTVREGAPEQLLVKEGAEISKLDRGANLEQNLKKLINGRIDCISFNIPSALYNLKEMGENIADYELVYELKKLELFYAFEKSTTNNTIMPLQNALDDLKTSGDYDKIVSKHL